MNKFIKPVVVGLALTPTMGMSMEHGPVESEQLPTGVITDEVVTEDVIDVLPTPTSAAVAIVDGEVEITDVSGENPETTTTIATEETTIEEDNVDTAVEVVDGTDSEDSDEVVIDEVEIVEEEIEKEAIPVKVSSRVISKDNPTKVADTKSEDATETNEDEISDVFNKEPLDRVNSMLVDSIVVDGENGVNLDVTITNNSSVWTNKGHGSRLAEGCEPDSSRCGNNGVILVGDEVLGVLPNVEGSEGKVTQVKIEISAEKAQELADKLNISVNELEINLSVLYDIRSSIESTDITFVIVEPPVVTPPIIKPPEIIPPKVEKPEPPTKIEIIPPVVIERKPPAPEKPELPVVPKTPELAHTGAESKSAFSVAAIAIIGGTTLLGFSKLGNRGGTTRGVNHAGSAIDAVNLAVKRDEEEDKESAKKLAKIKK